MPAAKQLVTVLYRPRETMRAVLDGGSERWTAALVMLSYLASTSVNPDITKLRRAFPNISLEGLLAITALVLIALAACCVVLLYLFALVATLVGRWLDGEAAVADVRAALAWGLVPAIWSGLLRLPFAIFRFELEPKQESLESVGNFIASGGCSIAVLALTLQFVMYVWMWFVTSSTVGEALRFSSWKGFATIVITLIVPIVVMIAAAISF